MKVACGALLATAFLVGLASSLRCFECSNERDNEHCNQGSVQCVSENSVCQTNVSRDQFGDIISKGCAMNCDGATFCCIKDSCNKGIHAVASGAASKRTSYTELFLAAGVSALLLYAGL